MADDKTVVTVTAQVADGVVHMVDCRCLPDCPGGGDWHIGHVDVWEMLGNFEGRRVRVRVEVLDDVTE